METGGRIFLFALAFCWSEPAQSANQRGEFMTGGGVGSVPCVEFLDVMANARAQGGLASPAGSRLVYGYMMYVAGFETAYNSAAEGVHHIFDGFGSVSKVLVALEPWCSQHPTKNFDLAIFDLVKRLRDDR
ncbi:MAG: hypothetical protein KK482_08180 [Sinorhizobium meliloti]|nr:hypothetical protein [Sinorhizobium meliloti]